MSTVTKPKLRTGDEFWDKGDSYHGEEIVTVLAINTRYVTIEHADGSTEVVKLDAESFIRSQRFYRHYVRGCE